MFSIKTKIIDLLRQKELLITSVVILLCLFLSVFFPGKNTIYGLTKAFFFFFAIPVLFIVLVLRKKVQDFGLNIVRGRSGFFWALFTFISSSIIIYPVIKYTQFLSFYKIDPLIMNNFWFFLLVMMVVVNLNLFFQEFFFRGFIISVFSSSLSFGAVFVQAGLFFLTILIVQGGFRDEAWQLFPHIILSITGGIAAYRSRSMVYSWIGGMLFLIVANAYIISLLK